MASLTSLCSQTNESGDVQSMERMEPGKNLKFEGEGAFEKACTFVLSLILVSLIETEADFPLKRSVIVGCVVFGDLQHLRISFTILTTAKKVASATMVPRIIVGTWIV